MSNKYTPKKVMDVGPRFVKKINLPTEEVLVHLVYYLKEQNFLFLIKMIKNYP
jgi:hypothetical protein